MPESEALSALIGDIYDAALDSSQWPSVLQRTCGFVQGHSGSLFAQDTVRPHATMFHDYGHDPRYLQLYREKYVHMNPLLPSMTFFKVGEVFAQFDLIPEAEYRATRFYEEFARPQGIVDSLFANVEKAGTSYGVLSMTRSEREGPVDAAARRRMALVVPHVRRSVLIGQVMERHEAEKVALADAFDQVAAAVFLVDASGRIAFTNASAQVMIREGKILHSGRSVLAAVDQTANRALQDAFVAASRGDQSLGLRGVAIPLAPAHDRRWFAHVLPLTAGARQQAGTTYSAVAAVFVRKAALETASPLEILGKLFKLTASELRVLQGVLEIGGAPEVAATLGISEATVKTHLRSLFGKTGARRQADLVKLVATYASPVTS